MNIFINTKRTCFLGLVVNIGSLTGVLPMPLLSVYAASKIFVDHLSRSLYYEYIDQGVFIQHVAPCFVSSKMSRQRESFFVPSPKKFVKSALCSAFRLKVKISVTNDKK